MEELVSLVRNVDFITSSTLHFTSCGPYHLINNLPALEGSRSNTYGPVRIPGIVMLFLGSFFIFECLFGQELRILSILLQSWARKADGVSPLEPITSNPP